MSHKLHIIDLISNFISLINNIIGDVLNELRRVIIFIGEIDLIYSYKLRQEYANWIASGDWNICGTLNFAVNQKPSIVRATRLWSLYWNKIDRLCYGQSGRAQYRLPRFVYVHMGGGGNNPHIHFLTTTSTNVKEFCFLLNAIWAGMNDVTADASQNEILPVFSKRAAAWYLMHEDQGYQMNGLSERLTHLPQGKQVFRADALDRMALAAPRDHQLDDAAQAYDMQFARAKIRHEKRVKARNIGAFQIS